MSLQLIFLWSKKIHRWILALVTLLGLWMMTSGWLMHRDMEGDWIPKVDMGFVRYYHNVCSTWFLVILGAQLLTGLLMWAIPEILKRRNKKTI